MSEYKYHHAGNSETWEMISLSHLFAQSGALAATGVLDGLVVTQATTANGTVLIAPGSAVCHSSISLFSLLVCDTQKTLDIFTANPMGGLPRNDIVVFDSITATIMAIIGTPNATPTDPTVPATAVALVRLRNLASATTIPTAQIDTLIVATTLRGIPAPVVDTGWLGLTALGTQWNAPTGGSHATARRIGNRVYMTGLQRANSSTIGIGTTTGLGTLPAGMFPPAGYNGWAVGWISGGTDVPAEVSITTAGVVSVTNTSVLTGIEFFNISFLMD